MRIKNSGSFSGSLSISSAKAVPRQLSDTWTRPLCNSLRAPRSILLTMVIMYINVIMVIILMGPLSNDLRAPR